MEGPSACWQAAAHTVCHPRTLQQPGSGYDVSPLISKCVQQASCSSICDIDQSALLTQSTSSTLQSSMIAGAETGQGGKSRGLAISWVAHVSSARAAPQDRDSSRGTPLSGRLTHSTRPAAQHSTSHHGPALGVPGPSAHTHRTSPRQGEAAGWGLWEWLSGGQCGGGCEGPCLWKAPLAAAGRGPPAEGAEGPPQGGPASAGCCVCDPAEAPGWGLAGRCGAEGSSGGGLGEAAVPCTSRVGVWGSGIRE